MKKWMIILVAAALLAVLSAGCGSNSGSNSSTGSQAPSTGEASEEKKQLKIALLLPGPINDMGWNASAYEGLKQAEEKYGASVAYVENVAQSDMEENFRGFALQGYDLIIGHGFQFGDAAMKVASQFPNVKFVVTSSNISQAPNVASVNIDNEMQGFVMGAVAALLTKSGTVGAIGGEQIPPIVGSVEGFEKGAKYINPNIKVLTAYTGNFNDVNKAKETALAMIAQGADIIMANANQAGLGSIQACQEKKVLAIGSNMDQNPIAPDTVVVSVIKSVPVLISYVVDLIYNNEFEAKFYNLGVKEGAVYLSPWHGFEDKIPQDVKDRVAGILKDLEEGKLDIQQYK
ncbi:BMP family protein [Moorellaceae bacterium AZ2]